MEAELEKVKEVYFASFPDVLTRHPWPDITYALVRPHWVRFSDFTVEPPAISEQAFSQP